MADIPSTARLPGKNGLPVTLHVHDCPALSLGLRAGRSMRCGHRPTQARIGGNISLQHGGVPLDQSPTQIGLWSYIRGLVVHPTIAEGWAPVSGAAMAAATRAVRGDYTR